MTVFEISPFFPEHYYLSYFQIVIGALIAVAGIVLRVLHFKGREKKFKPYTGTAMVALGVVFLLIGPYNLSQNKYHEHLYAQYKSERYSVVEGIVKVLREQPKAGHAPGDLINIVDKEFVIAHQRGAFTYQIPISHGGYLQDGVSARIYYLNNDILKIELQ